MIDPALALLELNSVAHGMVVADAVVKRAPVRLLDARPVTPGKYLVVWGGESALVHESLDAGLEAAGSWLVDRLLLDRIHPQVFAGLAGIRPGEADSSLAVIETVTVAATILAADAAAKAAGIMLSQIRLANGLGGKSFVVITGEQPDVEAALAAGVEAVQPEGMLITHVLIPRLHDEARARILAAVEYEVGSRW